MADRREKEKIVGCPGRKRRDDRILQPKTRGKEENEEKKRERDRRRVHMEDEPVERYNARKADCDTGPSSNED